MAASGCSRGEGVGRRGDAEGGCGERLGGMVEVGGGRWGSAAPHGPEGPATSVMHNELAFPIGMQENINTISFFYNFRVVSENCILSGNSNIIFGNLNCISGIVPSKCIVIYILRCHISTNTRP